MYINKVFEKFKKPSTYKIICICFVGIVSVVTVVSRFYGLGQKSFWYDELWLFYKTTLPLHDILERDVGTFRPAPIPFILILKGISTLFGTNDYVLKIFSATLSALSVLFLYLLTKKNNCEQNNLLACRIDFFI